MPASEAPPTPKCTVCEAFRRIMDVELRRQYPEADQPGVLLEIKRLRAEHLPTCRKVARVSA